MDVNLGRLLKSGHSQQIDEALGFQIPAIERGLLHRARERNPAGDHHTWGASLHDGSQSWVGLDPQTLQTPYEELIEACELVQLKDGEKVVDLGAGYGRLGFVLRAFYPTVSFLGLELVPERVAEGKRIFKLHGLSESDLQIADLTRTTNLPEADVYFLYDFGKVLHMRTLLTQLGSLADQRSFRLIGRGKGIRSLIENEFPWLTITEPVVRETYSIYLWKR